MVTADDDAWIDLVDGRATEPGTGSLSAGRDGAAATVGKSEGLVLDDQTRQRLEVVRLKAAGIGPLPTEVRNLLDEERDRSGGNLAFAIERLCQRLADDTSLADLRGQLVRWLLSAELSDRFLPWGWRRDADMASWQVPQPWKARVRNRPKS